jgi:hypothetical protein
MIGDSSWLNWRPSGGIWGKWRQLVRNVREWYVESRHLYGCSPRLCRLRTGGLTYVNKYWTYRSHAGDMGLVSIVVGCRRRVALPPTASMAGSEEKLGMDPRINGSGSVQRYWKLRKRVPHTGIARRKHMPDIRRLAWEAYVSCWSGFPLQGVHWFELSRLSDMSNRLFVTVIM